MRSIRARWGMTLICPLLLSSISGCDAPPPAFKELAAAGPNGEGQGYSGDALDPNHGAGDNDPEHDDRTPADRGEADQGPLNPYARWSFRASKMEQGSLALDLAGGQLEQRFSMDSNLITQNLSFTQISRPVITESFAQGSTQESRQELFTQNQNPSGLLDILLVVDDSGSMKEEQANLSNKLMPLLSYVQDSDWRIGVVTTDPAEGCLRGLIKKGDAQASALFAQAVNAGTQGSGNERGILQAVSGLKGECNANGSWVRKQSTLAVLIVSDEDNCSDAKGCGTDPWASSAYLYDYLASIRQVGTNARVYGLIWHPTQLQSACNTGYNKGSTYADVISRTGGSWGSICDTDYSKTLQSVSKDLSVILKTQFALQYAPTATSLKVFVNGSLLTSGYQVRGNVLEFLQAPAAGSQIQVQYSFVAQPPKRSFALTQDADPSTLQVYLDGAKTTAFSFDAATQTVNFSQAPQVQEVRVVYRRPGELKRDFTIGGPVKAGTLQVKVNQQVLASSAYSYQSASGIMTLNQAPVDQAAIEVSFSQETAPRLRYPIYATDSQKAGLQVYDAQTRTALRVSVDGDELVFDAGQFRPLRSILVRYPQGVEESRVLELPYAYLPASVQVKGERSGLCRSAVISEGRIDMRSCRFLADEGIAVNFLYEKEHQTSFDLGNLDLDLSQYRWRVTVNGQATQDYQINQQRLDFVSLPLDAVVEVTLSPR